jgi:PKD repeat protein
LALLSAGCIGPPAVQNESPVAQFTISKEVAAINEAVVFDGNRSYDPDGSVAIFQWNLGDGSQESGPIVTHRYIAAGRLVVTLTVTDVQGAQNSRALNLTVNAPPTASVSVSPGPYFAKEPIAFSASDSRDPDGRIAAFDWDLGDGQTATTETVSHAYVDAGTYTVQLTVSDANGATASATTTFFVDLHSYDVAFEERSQMSPPVRNFTLANQTKTITLEIFLQNLTQVNFTLSWRDPMPVQGPPNDIVAIQVTSPDGPSMRATGTWDNVSLTFNLNAIPSPVQVRAATAADVPGVLGDAYVGTKGVGVWIVEITAVELGGGFVQDEGFVPEPFFVWTLNTTLTAYQAVPTQIG